MSQTTPHIDVALDLKALKKLQTYLAGKLARYKVHLSLAHKELTLTTPKANLVTVLQFLKTDKQTRFTQLMDLAGVDWLGHRPDDARFTVAYHLLSLEHNQRLRVLTTTGIKSSVIPVRGGVEPPVGAARGPHPIPGQQTQIGPDTSLADPIPTVAHLYPAATWFERETWDMYGIPFAGNDDLRRLLTDYDFVGHPLRKDFPLNGYTEVYFNEEENRVAYKPVDLPQPFRHFDKVSEWQGMNNPTHLADEDNTFSKEEFK